MKVKDKCISIKCSSWVNNQIEKRSSELGMTKSKYINELIERDIRGSKVIDQNKIRKSMCNIITASNKLVAGIDVEKSKKILDRECEKLCQY